MLNELFEKWLQTNQNRFRYKPIKAGLDIYKFEGIIDNVYLLLQEETTESMILYDYECESYGILVDLGYLEKVKYIEGKGYTDLGWLDECIQYFLTYEEMVYATIFEPIVVYCDKHFIDGNHLYVVDMDGIVLPSIGGESKEKEIQKLKEKCTKTPNHKPNECEIYKYDIFANKGKK